MNKIIWNNNNTISIEQTKEPKKITGTRLASILGLNPYSTPFSTWCEMTHTYEDSFEDNMFTLAGKAIEPKQAVYMKTDKGMSNLVTPTEKFGESYFTKTHGNFFTDTIFGGMWDYIIEEDSTPVAVLEMKTTGVKKIPQWLKAVPEYYLLQAALYAYLLNVDDIYMVVSFLEYSDYNSPNKYIPSEDNTWVIPFKLSEKYPTFEEDYIIPAMEWWKTYIVGNMSPPISNNELDLDIVRKLKELEEEAMTQINEEKVNTIINETNANAEYFQTITDNVVAAYTSSLDRIMGEIHDNIVVIENPSLHILEKYFLELSNCMYFMSERTEKLGIYDSLTKAAAQEVYNNTYLQHQMSNFGVVGAKKPTVAESTATAQNATIYESIMNDVYNKAYKIVKAKLDSANTMISALSKIISRRMNETQMLSNPTGRQILHEEVSF